jgi:hypothetical protein
MAFKLDQKPYYKWPVEFEVPVDGGAWEKQSFDGHFARLGQERVEYLTEAYTRRVEELKAGIELDKELAVLTPKAIAREILIGWDSIFDDDGNEIPCTPAIKERVLEVETVAAAVINAWSASLQGSAAKKQTSRKSRGIG